MALVTAATGKAATGINGTAVHIAVDSTIYKTGKQFGYKKGDEELDKSIFINIAIL